MNDNASIEITTTVGPWAMVPIWVMPYCVGEELAVYTALRSFADRSGDCHPRTPTIAERAGTSVSMVRNTVQKFRRYKVLSTTEIRTKDGTFDHFQYHLADIDPGTLAQYLADRETEKNRRKTKRNTPPVTAGSEGGVTAGSDQSPPAETEETPGENQSLQEVTPPHCRKLALYKEEHTSKNTPITPKRETRASKPAASSGPKPHPLPEDFVLTDAMRRTAASTFPTLDVDYETAQFRDHYVADGARRANWYAEWQKWMRRSAKFASERATRTPKDRSQRAQAATDAMFEGMYQRAVIRDAQRAAGADVDEWAAFA